MFKEWLLLSEMPISSFNTIGNWSKEAPRKYGYNSQDAGIIGNPNAVNKIIKSWNNTKQNYHLYFVRKPKAWLHREIGEATPEWVKENLKLDIPEDENAITVIFTNNIGDEKIPMTSWTIGHRFGHALVRNSSVFNYFHKEVVNDFTKILEEIYNFKLSYGEFGYSRSGEYVRLMTSLMQSLGTMRSAREGNLRNIQEFPMELIAQYLITGKIKFNPLPKFIISRNRKAWGHDASEKKYSKQDEVLIDQTNLKIQYLASKYESKLDSILENSVGKIFVM